VLGVIAALTFAASLDHLTSHPRLFGFGWDANVVLEVPEPSAIDSARAQLLADGRLAALAEYGRTSLSFDGAKPVDGLALRSVEGAAGPTLLRGRLPRAHNEVALETSAVRGSHAGLGDVVRANAGAGTESLRVVGELTGTGLGAFVVTPDAVRALEADVSDKGFFVAWRPGIDAHRAASDLRGRFAEVDLPAPTARVANLARVRGFPYAMAAFVGLLGVLAVGHLLVLMERRRRGELALVRALGMTRRQVAGVVAWQATTVAVMAAAIGVPLGIAAGLRSWALVAASFRVVPRPALPVVGVVTVVIAAALACNAAAFAPARRARRARVVDTLRAE
jgi:putative ABC transport system permease protein